MYSHFISYLGFCSAEEDQIHNGATLHDFYPILSIQLLLMPWLLKSPGHQQALYWPNKQEYSVSSIRRVNLLWPREAIITIVNMPQCARTKTTSIQCLQHLADSSLVLGTLYMYICRDMTAIDFGKVNHIFIGYSSVSGGQYRNNYKFTRIVSFINLYIDTNFYL